MKLFATHFCHHELLLQPHFPQAKRAGYFPLSRLHHSAFKINYTARQTQSLAENHTSHKPLWFVYLHHFLLKHVYGHRFSHGSPVFTAFPEWNRLQTLQHKKKKGKKKSITTDWKQQSGHLRGADVQSWWRREGWLHARLQQRRGSTPDWCRQDFPALRLERHRQDVFSPLRADAVTTWQNIWERGDGWRRAARLTWKEGRVEVVALVVGGGGSLSAAAAAVARCRPPGRKGFRGASCFPSVVGRAIWTATRSN